MTPAVKSAALALAIGLATTATAVAVILWVTNDMRLMLLLGAVGLFGGALWVGSRRRGGSTITQQTAKNVFLWNGGGYARKAIEAWAALYINTVWGKRRTMEVYLNVAEWGDGIFGAEAAAQARFGKSAKDVTADEAALLAAVLPSPNKWRVDSPSAFVNGRADTLMQRAEIIRTSRYDACLLAS